MIDRYEPFPLTANRQDIPSCRKIEIVQITTSTSTAQQITFTNYIKKILLYNASAETAEIINLLATSDGTLGLPIQPSANPIALDIAGEKTLNLWVKSASGAPKLTVVGLY